MNAPLYNRDILALAVETAKYLPRPEARHHASLRAPLCGSRILIDLDTDAAGRVADVGMHVEACALGQAAATLFARHAPGRAAPELKAARDQIARWFGAGNGGGDDALGGEGTGLPDWPDFALLAPARAYPARHGAILLPFDAALAALSPAMQRP